MPANMISAPLASTLVVIGSSSATVTAGPTPGNTPTAVPSRQPIRQNIRFWTVRATAKPWISCAQMSMRYSSGRKDLLQETRGQREAQAVVEDREHDRREEETDDQVEQPAPAGETARDQHVEHGG